MWNEAITKRRNIGVLFVIALSTLIFIGKSSKQDLTIIFTGYTNTASGVQGANFIVSNVAGRVVYVSDKGSAQRKERGEWIETAPANTRIIGLQPRETFVVTVLKPTNCETWRVFLTSGRPRSSFVRRIGKLYESQPFQFQPLSYLFLAPVLRQTLIYSEEVHDQITEIREPSQLLGSPARESDRTTDPRAAT